MQSKFIRKKHAQKAVFIGIVSGSLITCALFVYLLTQPTGKQLSQVPAQQVAQSTESVPSEPPRPKLPFGDRSLIPDFRFVALYGSPAYKGLGSLGEQPLEQAITRTQQVAAAYQPLATEKIIPTFEIITTVASAGPTDNGDYSQELSIESIRPWVDAAKAANMYVVLDLQSGRSSFLEQAKLYEPLLLEPHVGLALDPEWRLLTPQARHLKTVGSVDSSEINQTATWLADLTKTHDLPQKMLIIHQFKLSMVTNRELLDTSRPELAYIIHVDGFGALGSKENTWRTIKAGLPPSIHLGWKNFYDEDKPTPTPEETMSQEPKPVFISFQ